MSIHFVQGGKKNLAHDRMFRLLARCIVEQQVARFEKGGEPLVDIRKFECPNCKAPGFNNGRGEIEYLCSARAGREEPFSGIWFEPCGAKKCTT